MMLDAEQVGLDLADLSRSTQVKDGSTTTLTQLAARHLQKIRESDLNDTVQQEAITALLDYLGALISGLSAPWSDALLKYAKAACSTYGQAHAIGLSAPVSAEIAAFVNGAVAHSIIRDDMHISAGAHIGVMVMPAALALAEREDWSGTTLLKAIVAGYDMAAVLGSAVRSSSSCNPHFRPSGIIGAFAAAAVGIVADETITLDVAASALGLGANMAAGLNEWPWAGGMEINTQMGTASGNGIASLDLARHGILSSETVLEGRDGLFAAYGCGSELPERLFRHCLDTSEVGFGIMGTRFKPVTGCNFIQTPVSIVLNLRSCVAQLIEQVEKVRIVTTTAAKSYPGCDNYGPFEKVQQTKMSLQYAVAAALLFGRIDEETYRMFHNKTLLALIRKCHVETDFSYDQALKQGKQPCRIEVVLKDGTRFEDSMIDVPWLDASSVEERFRKEAGAMFSPADVDGIVTACKVLAESKTCAQLFELLDSKK